MLIWIDVCIAVGIVISIVTICAVRFRRKRRIQQKLKNIRIMVKGRVESAEFLPDTFTDLGMHFTLWGNLCGKPKGQRHTFKVRILDSQEDIRGKTLQQVMRTLGKAQYSEISRHAEFIGTETKNNYVFIEVDQDEFTTFEDPFEAPVWVCPLKNNPIASFVQRDADKQQLVV